MDLLEELHPVERRLELESVEIYYKIKMKVTSVKSRSMEAM